MKLCETCIKTEINPSKPLSTIKSIIYVEQKSNIGKLIDELYVNKSCRPNLVKELGNDSYKTATDRFNNEQHNAKMEELKNTPLILPPDIEFD